VTLMLGGTQAANVVMLRNGLGACGGVGGTAFARQAELRIEMAKMSPNMAENGKLRR
jgi:hypothetical protein